MITDYSMQRPAFGIPVSSPLAVYARLTANPNAGAFSGEVGLLNLSRMTIADHFQDRVGRRGSLVESELAHAANRVNYNQVRDFFTPRQGVATTMPCPYSQGTGMLDALCRARPLLIYGLDTSYAYKCWSCSARRTEAQGIALPIVFSKPRIRRWEGGNMTDSSGKILAFASQEDGRLCFLDSNLN